LKLELICTAIIELRIGVTRSCGWLIMRSEKVIKSRRSRDKNVEKTVSSKKPTSKKLAKGERENARTRNEIVGIMNRPKSTRTLGNRDAAAFSGPRPKNRSGELSGDLQALPEVEHLDSENLLELIEEGNAFEANVLTGVEDAEDNEGKEVHTHEVPEDDVPGEYLDQD
jgi:hypothetical protein